MTSPTLEITFDASGAAEAGRRGRAVAIVDVVDAATSAEAALQAGAAAVLGAAPADSAAPVPVMPERIALHAGSLALELGTSVIILAEPRIGGEAGRSSRIAGLVKTLKGLGVHYDVAPNQGAEVTSLVDAAGKIVVVVSAAGGTAFDAAMAAGSPAACFATTGRVAGKTGWEVIAAGARRAIELARTHETGLTLVASSANSADDVLGAMELAREIIREGFTRPPSR